MPFVLGIISLLAIIVEDVRYRAIHWYWIALLFIACCLYCPITIDFWINLGILASQLILTNLYFCIKESQWVNIVNNYLGLGDILFFIPVCILFSPIQFILYFITGLCFSLLLFFIVKIFLNKDIQTVPLAAYLSIYLFFFQSFILI